MSADELGLRHGSVFLWSCKDRSAVASATSQQVKILKQKLGETIIKHAMWYRRRQYEQSAFVSNKSLVMVLSEMLVMILDFGAAVQRKTFNVSLNLKIVIFNYF
jgi:hypothetical protein